MKILSDARRSGIFSWLRGFKPPTLIGVRTASGSPQGDLLFKTCFERCNRGLVEGELNPLSKSYYCRHTVNIFTDPTISTFYSMYKVGSNFNRMRVYMNKFSGRIKISFLMAGLLLFVCLALPQKLFAQAPEPRGAAALSAFDRLPYFKNGTVEKQASSYQRNNGNPDNSAYSYYKNPSTGGYVVLEEYAPGTIYRIWATELKGGNIRIYFDGQSTPRINQSVTSFFSGTSSPFLAPLVGNDQVSSGGFYSYYPISWQKSVRVEFTAVPSYYNINYHTYNSSTGVTTYTGSENLTTAYNAWKNPLIDPKSTTGNQTASTGSFSLAAGQSQELLNVSQTAGSVRSVKLTFPQFKTTQTQSGQTVTDNGRAFTGSSTFRAAIQSANSGVVLTRRLDYGIANQTADVYVDGVLAGHWSTPGTDLSTNWRDSDFTIPANLTQGKTQITIKVQFVSAQVDWNEFYYWVKTKQADGSLVQTDTVDVGNTVSEFAHGYAIVSQTWSGTRTFTYPSPYAADPATLDILRNARIQAYWDGETTPSVDVPLGFFYGVGSSGEGNMKGLLVGVDPTTHTYYNYFPMPYSTSARIVLVNNSGQTITNATGMTQYNPAAYSNLGADAGYFVAQYNREAPTTSGKDFVWGNFPSGTGHIVASSLTINNAAADDVLEGDERVFVDSSSYQPQLHGTGTEDMFNGGFYFSKGIFNLPVHGAPLRYVDAVGNHQTSMYRLELADAIPFEKSVLFKIEHGPADDVNAAYEGGVFAYIKKNAESLIQTDSLKVSDAASEAAHKYSITKQNWTGPFTNDYFGRDVPAVFSGNGRAQKGTSQFTMAVNSSNQGVRLSRIMDHGVANQKAKVYVNNVLVGTWFTGGDNQFHKARYDSFEIPASYTAGKSSIPIKIQFVSSANDWNEFVYDAYSHMNTQQIP